MFKLALADMQKNLKLFFGTFVAIMVTTAIVTACLNLVFSATAHFTNGDRFGNVALVLMANQQITLETVDDDGDIEVEKETVTGRIPLSPTQIERLQSNYTLIEDYTFFVSSNDLRSKKLAGHNISSMGLTGFSLQGDKPEDHQVVIDEQLATVNDLQIGDTVVLYTNTTYADYEVSGIVSSTGKEDFTLQNYIFFSDDVAKAQAKGCQSVAILDEDAHAEAFDNEEFTVLTGADTSEAELSAMVSNDISLMVIFITMGSVCLVISLFVISGTMQFSIKNRYRLLAQLRVIGLKKTQISAILSWQTAMISIVASAVGLVCAYYLSHFIAKLYLDMSIVSADFEPIFSLFWGVVAAVAITLLSLMVTALTASKPLSIPPAAAMKSEGEIIGKTSPVVVLFGMLLVLGGVAILRFTPMTQGIGIGMVFCASTVFLAGAICLMPLMVRLFNVLLSVVVKGASRNLGQVAYGNIKMKASKFAVAAVSVAIMMSMGSVMVLSNEVYIETSKQQQYTFAQEYAYVNDGKFTYEMTQYHDIFAVKHTQFLLAQGEELNDYNVLAVFGATPKLHLIEKTAEVSDHTVWVSEVVRNVQVGDTLSVYLENGEQEIFTVGGIFETEGLSDENNAFVVDYQVVQHSFYDERLPTVYTQEPLFSDSTAHTLQIYENAASYDIQYAASLLLGMIGLVLSVVALFNTFFVIMSVRTEEFHRLKLIGAKKQQIFKMATTEVVIVVFTGMVIGSAVIAACVGQYAFVNTGVFDFIVNPTIFWGMIVITAVLSLLAGILPSFITITKMKKQFRSE